MKLYPYLYKKINDQMRMIYITQTNPKKKIKLDPIDPEDLNIDIPAVSRWSQNNKQLCNLLLNNGMAEFICNKEFLNQFYTHLQFMYSGITEIDSDFTKLTKIKVLNLFQNKISVVQNIPLSCKQLYLDFNQISSVKFKNVKEIELLSVSHNKIDDKVLTEIISKTPTLRCLNISHNRIQNIRLLVQNVKKCPKLKILISRNNPISMLSFYWDYLTAEIQLDYFDNQKYVKPQPIKPPQPKQQKKQQKKEQKKDTKKDTKKGGKVQQKPVEQQKKVEVKIQVPKVRTDQDFRFVRLKIQINVLQCLTGVIYDSSIFPQQNLNIKKTQSCFWVEAEFFDKKFSTQQSKISMDSIMPDGQINRIGFQLKIQQKIQVNYQNFIKVNKGITIYIFKQEPVVDTDPQSGEQKVALTEQKQIKMRIQCVGGTFINLQELWSRKKKEIQKNYNIFKQQAVNQPLFKKPFQNQKDLISKNKVQFDTKLAALQQQRRKKQQEQQAAKAQKKGGKDTKKAPAKKQTKKDSKQPVGEKKAVQKCPYPIDTQQYRYLEEQKMYKCLKQHLGVKVTIE